MSDPRNGVPAHDLDPRTLLWVVEQYQARINGMRTHNDNDRSAMRIDELMHQQAWLTRIASDLRKNDDGGYSRQQSLMVARAYRKLAVGLARMYRGHPCRVCRGRKRHRRDCALHELLSETAWVGARE